MFFGSSSDLLHHIRASGDSSQIHGYLIHSLRFKDSETMSKFWQIQTTIIAQLRTLWNLQVVVAIIIPDHDGWCIRSFKRTLKVAGWCISTHDDVSFTDMGDSIAGSCSLLFGIHSSCTATVEPFELKSPPPIHPRPLSDFLWEPFSPAGPNIPFGLLAIMPIFVVRMYGSAQRYHRTIYPFLKAFRSSTTFMGMVPTRVVSVAQQFFRLTACAHLLMPALLIKICSAPIWH